MLRTQVALAVAFAAASTLYAASDAPVHRTFNVAPGGTLTIDADSGDIQVTPGTGNSVTLDVTQRSRSDRYMDVTAEQQQNDVVVRAKYEHTRFASGDNETKFVVTVPSRYNVQLGTAGGDIRVSDLQGEAHAKTSGGDIVLGNIAGTVNASTSGGDVTLQGSRGPADVRTSGGAIHVGNVDGNLQVKTSGGSIDIKRAGADLYARTSGGGITIDEVNGTVDAQTSGGSIHARLAGQPRGDSRLSTSGGGISLSLAPNVAVDLDAHTSGGDIDTDVTMTVSGMQNESSIQGRINGGGPKLVLRSSGGGIRIRKM